MNFNSVGRGDNAHTLLMEGTIGVGRKHKVGWGDTAHTLFMGEQLGWGHHTTFKEKIYMVGWAGHSFRNYCHFVGPSCNLELARLSALLRIQDGAECVNKAEAV